jgi:hypothetical protein
MECHRFNPRGCSAGFYGFSLPLLDARVDEQMIDVPATRSVLLARQRHLLGDEQPPPRLVPWPIPREEVGVVSQQLLKHSFARVRLLRHRD